MTHEIICMIYTNMKSFLYIKIYKIYSNLHDYILHGSNYIYPRNFLK